MSDHEYKRRWYSGLVANFRTCIGVVKSLSEMRLWILIPFLFVLFVIAVGLYFGKFVAPVAPFVYSLF